MVLDNKSHQSEKKKILKNKNKNSVVHLLQVRPKVGMAWHGTGLYCLQDSRRTNAYPPATPRKVNHMELKLCITRHRDLPVYPIDFTRLLRSYACFVRQTLVGRESEREPIVVSSVNESH